MIVVSFGGNTPRVADSALVAESACLIGDVEVGENSSIWPGVVIRGDIQPIRIGSNCHVEDNSVLHGYASLGDDTLVAHGCVVEGRVGKGTIISNGAAILLEAEIGDSCLIAAKAVVLENTKVPNRSFVAGVPGKIKGEISRSHIEKMEFYAPYYAQLVKEYKRQGIWKR